MPLRLDDPVMDHAGFESIQAELTKKLWIAIQTELEEMGEDAKGISWSLLLPVSTPHPEAELTIKE